MHVPHSIQPLLYCLFSYHNFEFVFCNLTSNLQSSAHAPLSLLIIKSVTTTCGQAGQPLPTSFQVKVQWISYNGVASYPGSFHSPTESLGTRLIMVSSVCRYYTMNFSKKNNNITCTCILCMLIITMQRYTAAAWYFIVRGYVTSASQWWSLQGSYVYIKILEIFVGLLVYLT